MRTGINSEGVVNILDRDLDNKGNLNTIDHNQINLKPTFPRQTFVCTHVLLLHKRSFAMKDIWNSEFILFYISVRGLHLVRCKGLSNVRILNLFQLIQESSIILIVDLFRLFLFFAFLWKSPDEPNHRWADDFNTTDYPPGVNASAPFITDFVGIDFELRLGLNSTQNRV